MAVNETTSVRTSFHGRLIKGASKNSEKVTLFSLLDATPNTGISLTEHFAMLPAASVSGWYFAHPDSRYFGIGKIGRDQLADYAARKGISEDEAEKLLRPNL